MEDLDQYNGDAEHDMWVDFDVPSAPDSIFATAGLSGKAIYTVM